MALNGLKCILIDVDNTLLDFEKSSQTAIIRTCEDFKIPYSSELLAVFLKVNNEMWRQIQDGALTKEQLWQTRWNKIFNISGITADGPHFEAEFHRYLQDSAVPIDGALEALKYLSSKYKVCTASNASFKQQRHRLELTGMLNYIDKMFVSEQLGAQKPSSAFFKECFKHLKYLPSETLMIGDDLHADMLGAASCEIHTCWFNPSKQPNIENVAIDIQISKLSELSSFV